MQQSRDVAHPARQGPGMCRNVEIMVRVVPESRDYQPSL